MAKPLHLHPLKDRDNWTEFWLGFFHGIPPILTGDYPIHGRINQPEIKSLVVKTIRKIAKQSTSFKIGAMGDFDVRMDDKVYRKKYEYVQLIFVSSSADIIKDLEVEMIVYFKRYYEHKIDNISTARAGRLTSYDDNYYVYVVYNK